ncbi:MAG TPA: ComF family protein [Anaerolineae bacterium]|nr:ComF family protein [Anaerolineae bacterium]
MIGESIWLDKALDLLFPPRCVACGRLGEWLCADCQRTIEIIPPPVCRFCALPLPAPGSSNSDACPRCQTRKQVLDGLVAYAFHNGPLRRAVHELKYSGLRSLARPLGRLMAERWPQLRPADQPFDVIVPVPLHRRRERERGYNQAALLARELGRRLQLPVVEHVLTRRRATSRQTDLDAAQRRANVQGAFSCRSDDLSRQAILLIDDVCTTGSTLEAAGSALKAAGAAAVWGYTLTRAH